jgi:MFS transporter, OPA family, sugar phosphate sensor protein UhpC
MNVGVLNKLKPAPYLPEIQDANVVTQQYKYWRWRIFSGMYVGYIFYYFARKSFTFAMPAMIRDLGYDKSDLGIIGSILAITYGVSKFLSGIMADRSNPRYFMAGGLILTGIFNILFGFSSSIFFFALFWGLNGWFQGWGWPPCARLLTHWYSQKERGTWWGFWNSSHGIGGALIPLVAAYCAETWGWRYALYVPGMLCILIGFYVVNRLRDTPQSLGLPPIEKFKNDEGIAPREREHELSMKEILFEHVLKNKYIWVLAVSYFFVYVIRQGINDWSALFLVETKGYSLLTAGACVCWFEIGGIFGSLVAGWASDKIFRGRRSPVNILFSVAVIGTLCVFGVFPEAWPLIDSLLMFVIGFFVFGPQMLIGMAAAELSHKKAAGSATGFTGCWAYLGAACAGYPLSKIAQEFGWYGFFVALGICGGASVLLLLPLWSIKHHPKYIAQETQKETS